MRGRPRAFAQPAPSDVYVNQVLSNISVAYYGAQQMFISPRVFPIVPVMEQTGTFFVYNKNDWMRDEAQRRPPATESAGGGYNLSQDTYNAEVWSFHKDVDNQTLANARRTPGVDMARDASAFVTRKMLIRQERQWAADYFVPNVWGTTETPDVLWSNYSSSTPITDIEAARRAILAVTGFKPNTIVAGWDVYSALKNHPDIIDRYKYTSAQLVTADLLASLFEVDNFYVAEAVYATNVEGETPAFDFMHGKHLWLGYVAPNPGLLVPSAGYIFMWDGVSEGLGTTIGISNFYIPEIKAERYEGEIAFDDKIVATDLGFFFESAVA